MRRLPVFYATTEGHTRRIAEVIASTLRQQGFDSDAFEVPDDFRSPDWIHIVSAVVGGSLHAGRHQSSLAGFVGREAGHLNLRPAAFFSVSLSAASQNPQEVAAARSIAEKFAEDLRWRPKRIACIAGQLAYTQYGFVKRWFMRRIAAKEGGPTDTKRDHDLTDWSAVRDFALAVAADAHRAEHARAS